MHPPSPTQTKRPKPWWQTDHRRQLSKEMLYLLIQGPLVISLEERWFAIELWRKHASSPRRWPTQYQWAQHFGVHVNTVARWITDLEAARMVTFHRPYNIRNAHGGWKGPRKPSGRYELHPPAAWRYKDDWIYHGEKYGWVTPDGKRAPFPPDVFGFDEHNDDVPRREPSTDPP